MHVFSANLNLDMESVGAFECGMERLVAVGFGNGDIVFEAVMHGFVEHVHLTENLITAVNFVGDNAETIDIHHFKKGHVFIAHLAVNAKQILLASKDLKFDVGLLKLFFDALLNGVNDLFTITTRFLNRGLQNFMAHWVQCSKSKYLHFLTDVVNTEPVGNGRINVQRFVGDTASLISPQMTQRAHVVKSVSQFDHDHTNISHHGHHHFAEVFSLCFCAGRKLDFGQFTDALNQISDRLSEFIGH